MAGFIFSTGIIQANTCHAVETIRINGSGSGLDMMKPLIAAYLTSHPEVLINMEKPLGSSGAIKALLAGALDLTVASRDLKPEESAKGARLKKYGKTPLAIVTENRVPKKDITTKELMDIYAGRTVTWQDGRQIRLVLRPREDADTLILRRLSPGMDLAVTASHNRPGMIVAITDPESYTTILKTPGSLGTSALNSIIGEKLPLTVLTLNGVKPSLNTVANGAYPLVKEINFVITAKTTVAAMKLIDFIFSPQGRVIARKAGVFITAGQSAGR